jgi:hypothetical protein
MSGERGCRGDEAMVIGKEKDAAKHGAKPLAHLVGVGVAA